MYAHGTPSREKRVLALARGTYRVLVDFHRTGVVPCRFRRHLNCCSGLKVLWCHCRRGEVLSRVSFFEEQQFDLGLTSYSKSSEQEPQHPPFRGRILVVDDDDDLRKLLRALLEGDGYQVFSCRDASRALKVFANRSDIDLLLTDFQMPEMSGLELSQRITEWQPGLPVLILSGVELPDEVRSKIAANGWELIRKPCEVPLLLHMIATRLQKCTDLMGLRK